MRWLLLVFVVLAGCATELDARSPVRWAPAAASNRCEAGSGGGHEGFDHLRSYVAVALGGPRHRGIDLVVSTDSPRQVLAGEIRYGRVDKALEHERVELYRCAGTSWQPLGTARTDEDGRFELVLTGAHRLPAGMHDVFVRVPGDGTGVGFLAYVAESGAPVVVSDVDGTLTGSENAIVSSVLFGREPGARSDAAAALMAIAATGRQPIYLTARGRWYTETTRRWLAAHGMPRGPIIVAPGMFTRPGAPTLAHKTSALAALRAAGVTVSFGIGNRASDIAAYRSAGLAPDHIFIEDGEYAAELAPAFRAHLATRFETYRELATLVRLARAGTSDNAPTTEPSRR